MLTCKPPLEKAFHLRRLKSGEVIPVDDKRTKKLPKQKEIKEVIQKIDEQINKAFKNKTENQKFRLLSKDPSLIKDFCKLQGISPQDYYSFKFKKQKPGQGKEISLSGSDLALTLNYGKYVIISAGYNSNSQKDREAMKKDKNGQPIFTNDCDYIKNRHKDLQKKLVDLGYLRTEGKGRYFGEEDSIICICHDVKDYQELQKFAASQEQDSIIQGIEGHAQNVYTTGANVGLANEGDGYKVRNKNIKNLYTEIKLTDGEDVSFTLNINFNKKTKPIIAKELDKKV